jgi:hypothetical protein
MASGKEISSIVTNHQDRDKMIDSDQTEYIISESTKKITAQML